MELTNLLKKLTQENMLGAIEFASDFLSDFMAVHTTPLGSLVAEKDGFGDKIMLEAHIDEIGFVVTNIDKNGFIKVNSYGGSDPRVLPASDITIYSERPVQGVVASTPPHLSKDNDSKITEISDLVVDVGSNFKYISLGDFATLTHSFSALKNNTVSAPALDNRAGVAVILRCAELLKDSGRKFSVVLSVGEEVNGSGASTAAFSVSPDVAIAVDVSFAKAPSIPDDKCSKLGGGPMIGISPVLDYYLSLQLVETAKNKDIPYSKEIMGSSTGTDADHISDTLGGIKTALVSIPLRNMHTGVEIVSLDDIEACAKLISEFVISGGIDND